MSKVVVTGCAGFIGSALSDRLLQEGFEVIGVDCFTNNYDKALKQRNLQSLLKNPNFTLLEKDILQIDWNYQLKGIQYVFHQAAIPGVRSSWGKSFNQYVENNVWATQILLEAAKNGSIEKFIYASSSSVYGLTEGSTEETRLPRPLSPYGVTKLAGEQLCHLYADNYQVPTVSLRYFTVYGPGQRPDMAFHKFIKAMLANEPITVFGDGTQTRDFTYISDAVEANLLAVKSPFVGEVFNIGGRSRIGLHNVIEKLGDLIGKKPKIEYLQKQAGDPPHTWANISKAEKMLAYNPKVSIEKGLKLQVEDMKTLYTQT